MSGNISLNTTTFYSELQSRLDAVTSATPSTELIKLFRISELYDGANYTTFAAELQSRLNAVASTTTNTDLLKLAASFSKIDNKNQSDIQTLLTNVASLPDTDYFDTALGPLVDKAYLDASLQDIVTEAYLDTNLQPLLKTVDFNTAIDLVVKKTDLEPLVDKTYLDTALQPLANSSDLEFLKTKRIFPIDPSEVDNFEIGDRVVYERYSEKLVPFKDFYKRSVETREPNLPYNNTYTVEFGTLCRFLVGRWDVILLSPVYLRDYTSRAYKIIAKDLLGEKEDIDSAFQITRSVSSFSSLVKPTYVTSPDGLKVATSVQLGATEYCIMFFENKIADDGLYLNGIDITVSGGSLPANLLGLKQNPANVVHTGQNPCCFWFDNNNEVTVVKDSRNIDNTVRSVVQQFNYDTNTLGNPVSIPLSSYGSVTFPRYNSHSGILKTESGNLVVADSTFLRILDPVDFSIIFEINVGIDLLSGSSASSLFNVGNNIGSIITTSNYISIISFSYTDSEISLISSEIQIKTDTTITVGSGRGLSVIRVESNSFEIKYTASEASTSVGTVFVTISPTGDIEYYEGLNGIDISPLTTLGSFSFYKQEGGSKIVASFLSQGGGSEYDYITRLVSCEFDYDTYLSVLGISSKRGKYKSPTIGDVSRKGSDFIEVDSSGYGVFKEIEDTGNLESGFITHSGFVKIDNGYIFKEDNPIITNLQGRIHSNLSDFVKLNGGNSSLDIKYAGEYLVTNNDFKKGILEIYGNISPPVYPICFIDNVPYRLPRIDANSKLFQYHYDVNNEVNFMVMQNSSTPFQLSFEERS